MDSGLSSSAIIFIYLLFFVFFPDLLLGNDICLYFF